MSQLPDPGFYQDPDNPTQERWWNGKTWVGQIRQAAGQPPLPMDPVPAVGAPAFHVEEVTAPIYQPGDVVNGHLLAADGQWYAVQPGAQAPPPTQAPPPGGERPLNNAYLWALAVIGPVFTFLQIFTTSTDLFWLLVFTVIGLNTVFAFLDEKEVKAARPEVKPVTFFWGFILVPVYLWLRRRDTRENQAPMIVWLVGVLVGWLLAVLISLGQAQVVVVPNQPQQTVPNYQPARVTLGDGTIDEFGLATAPVEITNPASNPGPCGFYLTITAESPDGTILYDSAAATVESLAPGQTYTTEIMFTEDIPPEALLKVRDRDCYPG